MHNDWEGRLPVLLELLQNRQTAQERHEAFEELIQMARMADKYEESP